MDQKTYQEYYKIRNKVKNILKKRRKQWENETTINIKSNQKKAW